MPVSTQRMLEALREQRRIFEREVTALQAEQKHARTDLGRASTEHAAAWDHLVSVLAPSLEPAALNACASRIQLREVEYARVAHRMNQERAALLKEEGALRANPLFRDREAKRNEASIRIHETEEALVPLEQSVQALESAPHFLEIVHSGYGTEGYAHKFWQVSFYRHWKHADLIVEQFAAARGVADFAALRARYQQEKAALGPLLANREEWRGLLQQVADIEAQHARVADGLTTLEARTLTWVRGRVREHLASLHENELQRLLGNDEELRVALARVLGAQAKQRYLEQLIENAIKPPLDDLRAATEKANRDLMKLARPKNAGRTWSDADFQRRFGKDRQASWEKRRARLRDARTRIVGFNDYDRYSTARDFLWWDAMTDGRIDGDFIDEVRERGPRHHADAAAVASSSARDDLVADVS